MYYFEKVVKDTIMKQYNITGMSCAACVARIEKAVGSVDGVETCSVSLLTNSMGVEGNVSPEVIIRAVEMQAMGHQSRVLTWLNTAQMN